MTGTSNTNVTWSPPVTQRRDHFQAPASTRQPANVAAAQQLTVTATSQADPTKRGECGNHHPGRRDQHPRQPTSTLTPAQSQQFTAAVTGTSDTNVTTWSLSSNVGTISSSGLYTGAFGANRRRCPATHCHRDQPGRSDQGGECGNHHPGRRDQHLANQRHTSLPLQSQQFTAAVTGTSNTNVTWSLQLQRRRTHFQFRPLHGRQRRRCPATHCHRDQPGRSDQGRRVRQLPSRPSGSASRQPTSHSLPLSPSNLHGCRDRNQQHQRHMVPQLQRRHHFQFRPSTRRPPATSPLPSNSLSPRPARPIRPSAASAAITIQAVGISISPTNVTLTPAQSQQFTAAVTGTSDTNVTWSLSSNVGTISSSGL